MAGGSGNDASKFLQVAAPVAIGLGATYSRPFARGASTALGAARTIDSISQSQRDRRQEDERSEAVRSYIQSQKDLINQDQAERGDRTLNWVQQDPAKTINAISQVTPQNNQDVVRLLQESHRSMDSFLGHQTNQPPMEFWDAMDVASATSPGMAANYIAQNMLGRRSHARSIEEEKTRRFLERVNAEHQTGLLKFLRESDPMYGIEKSLPNQQFVDFSEGDPRVVHENRLGILSDRLAGEQEIREIEARNAAPRTVGVGGAVFDPTIGEVVYKNERTGNVKRTERTDGGEEKSLAELEAIKDATEKYYNLVEKAALNQEPPVMTEAAVQIYKKLVAAGAPPLYAPPSNWHSETPEQVEVSPAGKTPRKVWRLTESGEFIEVSGG